MKRRRQDPALDALLDRAVFLASELTALSTDIANLTLEVKEQMDVKP